MLEFIYYVYFVICDLLDVKNVVDFVYWFEVFLDFFVVYDGQLFLCNYREDSVKVWLSDFYLRYGEWIVRLRYDV